MGCIGLAPNSSGLNSSALCEAACRAQPGCSAWQWRPARIHLHPPSCTWAAHCPRPAACEIGVPTCCNAPGTTQSDWVGGARAPLPALVCPDEDTSLVDVALDRRPYYSELNASLLLRSGPAALGKTLSVRAVLPAAGPAAAWSWPSVAGGTEAILPFSLSGLPSPIHNDMVITITVPTATGAKKIVKWRRFHRVPPRANGSVAAVQVDHSTRGLRIAGKAWNGVGFYVFDPGNLTTLTDRIIRVHQTKGSRGPNQVMVYALNSYTPAAQLAFFDSMAAIGVKIIYEMTNVPGCRGSLPSCSKNRSKIDFKRGGPFDDPALLKELDANVRLVKDHSALLGCAVPSS